MPLVSIIVPCYNEEATIRLLLDAIYSQNFPRSDLEVIISDGLSTDRTRQEVADFIQAHPDLSVYVVDNLKRSIPSGLNRAIDLAQGEYIVRLDAHSVPASDYVARCIADLLEDRGDNVGGVWDIQP
ncbi:MAG: glycosyltransferase, partial [Actinomycetota bacterium]|nr:glycosyltransferase [Actinomycetota bacterium]